MLSTTPFFSQIPATADLQTALEALKIAVRDSGEAATDVRQVEKSLRTQAWLDERHPTPESRGESYDRDLEELKRTRYQFAIRWSAWNGSIANARQCADCLRKQITTAKVKAWVLRLVEVSDAKIEGAVLHNIRMAEQELTRQVTFLAQQQTEADRLLPDGPAPDSGELHWVYTIVASQFASDFPEVTNAERLREMAVSAGLDHLPYFKQYHLE